MTGVAYGTGNAFPFGAPDLPLVYREVHAVLSFVSPYFTRNFLVFWILNFECSSCIIAWYFLFFTLLK